MFVPIPGLSPVGQLLLLWSRKEDRLRHSQWVDANPALLLPPSVIYGLLS
jgi:hypothetical protein